MLIDLAARRRTAVMGVGRATGASVLRGVRALAAFALVLVGAVPLAQAEPLPGPAATRIDLPLADGTVLTAHWYPLAGHAPRPAVIALHGCGGLWRNARAVGTAFEARYPEYIERLHAAGFHVLLPDSFTARGSGPICSQKAADRVIKVETRRADVRAGVQWLAARPDVDAARIVVLGWSHGAMTALSALDAHRTDAAAPVAGVIAFYPGCSWLLRRPFALSQPLLMLLGGADDWTPSAGCEQLVARTRNVQPTADVTLRVYPGAYHGFDGRNPVRFRAGLPNGVDAAGVHVGGDPQARDAAHAELDRFLARWAHAASPGTPGAPINASVPADTR
jgi:dienelactone hydrolase